MSKASVPVVKTEKPRASRAEILIWFGLALFAFAWTLMSTKALTNDRHRQGVEILMMFRAALAAGSGAALAWRISGGILRPWLPSGLVLAFLLLHAADALVIGTDPVHSGVSGAVFLLMAALYRGSGPLWWGFFVPVSALALFIPVGIYELSAPGHEIRVAGWVLRLSLMPSLSLIAGALLAVVRDTRVFALEANTEILELEKHGRSLVPEVKLMEKEMKALFADSRQSRAPMIYGKFSPDQQPASSLGYAEFIELILQKYHKASSEAPWAQVQLALPSEAAAPLALRGGVPTLEKLINSILLQAIDALGGGRGLVRVLIDIGLTSVVYTVEDNGRGLSEQLLEKMESRKEESSSDRLSSKRIREYAELLGYQLDYQARLGVGTRVSLIIPRADSPINGLTDVQWSPVRESGVSKSHLDQGSLHA